MKATGIVRRIDDLGRIVIPKEIRRTMRIREGDPLEIYTSRDGEVIFKKYSLLGGLDTPKGGEILFEGKNIAEMGLEQYRHNCVSFVFQNDNLIEYMTPKENVQLVDAHATTDTLHQVGLTDDEINRNVLKLSGGQQQRVAIARALASSASVILADEPTGNLDEDTAHDVTELLVERARSLNKCVIIVSHSNEVAAEGDVILRFSHGKIEVSS